MRILALLLALVLAPQAALARVAAFPETALRGDREISAFRVSASARQLADGRQETACFYDSTASAMTDDPINHRDPTGLLTVSKEFAKASPTATRLIKRLLDRLRSSPWWKDILFAYGRYGGASEREVVSALTWGQGPMLDSARTEAEELDPHDPSIVNVITACGSYDYENRPGVLKIDPERLAAFESGQLSEEALLGTILHELTHYFDHRRPEKDRLISEVGHSFEAWVFGRQACDPPPRPPRRKADAGRPLEIPADPFRFPRGPVQFPIPPMP